MVLGVCLVLVAGFAVAYPLWWNHRSHEVSSQIIKTFNSIPAQPAHHCVSPAQTKGTTTAAGLVQIPALSMTAPVLQGLSDAALAVAAAHDPESPWPGGVGESILESHDVSFFSRIGNLKVGQDVVWIDHCAESTFKVIGHEIVSPGTMLLPPSNDRGLALITCYPTDALFYVPDRYVLLTALVTQGKAKTTPGPVHVVTPQLKVPAPPDLVAQGLSLSQSDVLVGIMKSTGTPSPAWVQGPASLDLEALALESYIGAEKAIAQGNTTWWKDLAVPGLAMPAAWSNSLDTNFTEDLSGTTVVSVTLSSANVTFVLVPAHGDLLIKSVKVT
jgi:sortase A